MSPSAKDSNSNPNISACRAKRDWRRITRKAEVGRRALKDPRDTYTCPLLTAGMQLGYVSKQVALIRESSDPPQCSCGEIGERRSWIQIQLLRQWRSNGQALVRRSASNLSCRRSYF